MINFCVIELSCAIFFNFDCTAAWSLLQVLNMFDYKTALLALRSHLTVLLIVYGRFGAPPLNKKPEDYWTGETVDQAAWDKIIQEAIPQEYESHIFKVCPQVFESSINCPTTKIFYAIPKYLESKNECFFQTTSTVIHKHRKLKYFFISFLT